MAHTDSAAGDPADTTALAAGVETSGADDVLHRTTTLRHLPEQTDVFETEKTFDVPAAVVSFEVSLNDRADIQETDGFEETADGSYAWDETTEQPSIRFEMPADRTGEIDHAHTSSEQRSGYTFVDTGEWAVVQIPGLSVSLEQTSEVGIDETVEVDGDGVAGTDMAVFGEVSTDDRTVDGETITLAVLEPAADDLAADPDDILETLTEASSRLDVGGQREDVFIAAVPPEAEWGPQGLQLGESDAWVVADSDLERPDNVWLHEYVHIRQAYSGPDAGVTSETAWLLEAQADYYAALLSFELGLIEFEEFARFLERGEDAQYADDILSEPESWTGDRTDYVNGRLVYGELDRQLRLATDGDRSSLDVFRLLNTAEDSVSGDDYLEMLAETGGSDVRDLAATYTQTTETPSIWSQEDHAGAFDLEGAAISYTIVDDEFSVAGEHWPIFETDDRTTAVPAGEEVTVPVEVTNVGDRDGTADATLTVDGQVAGIANPELEMGEETTETFTWTPPEPGTYTLGVGEETITLHATTSDRFTVTDVAIDPATPSPGQDVTATVSLENEDTAPVAGVIPLETPEETVESEPVVLAGGDSTTVDVSLSFEQSAEHEVVAGTYSTTVTVQEDGALEAVDETPGFGIGVTLLVLLGTMVLLTRRV